MDKIKVGSLILVYNDFLNRKNKSFLAIVHKIYNNRALFMGLTNHGKKEEFAFCQYHLDKYTDSPLRVLLLCE